MHPEILTKKQKELLPLVKKFQSDFGLAGGTAIALQIGHRESLDFDLFSREQFDNLELRKKITQDGYKINRVLRDQTDDYTVLIKNVQFTFFHYPFPIKFKEKFEEIIKVPDLLTLGAMKAYALGRRPKWKDYVDLYFILKDFYNLQDLAEKAKKIFKEEFNEKIFRNQLAYFEDIDYSEEVIYKKGIETGEDKIKKELKRLSVEF